MIVIYFDDKTKLNLDIKCQENVKEMLIIIKPHNFLKIMSERKHIHFI